MTRTDRQRVEAELAELLGDQAADAPALMNLLDEDAPSQSLADDASWAQMAALLAAEPAPEAPAVAPAVEAPAVAPAAEPAPEAQATEPPWLRPGVALVVLGQFAAVVFRGHPGVPALLEGLSALAAVALALGVVWAGRGRPLQALGAVLGGSILVALPHFRELGFAWEGVPNCLLTELSCAVAPVGLAVGARLRGAPLGAADLATLAAAGALAAQAALFLLCPGSAMVGHVVVSHFGGVLVAAIIGGAAGAALGTPRRSAAS